MRANRSTPEAVDSRLLTWAAVLRAKGFHPLFRAWWLLRPRKLQGTPAVLEWTLPTCAEAESIYLDFHQNYRAFESWHLQQRRAALKVSMQESSKLAFRSILSKPSVVMDSLLTRQSATLLSVAPGTFTVTLDRDLELPSGCSATLDDVPAVVPRLDSGQFQIDCDLLLCPGQVLTVASHLTTTDEMLDAVGTFWQSRWSRYEQVPPDQWSRILRFTAVYLQPLPFELPQLSVPLWDSVVARFQPHAARGPDSFDRLDLRRMPQVFKHGLLEGLSKIEAGADWPKQLCLGIGHCLPKHLQAAVVNDYRPIIVFSMIYRAWASVRSRGILQALAQFAGPRMCGFLEHREAGDLWFISFDRGMSC